jgi:hypothetical protein
MATSQFQEVSNSFLLVKVSKYFQKYFVRSNKLSISKNNGLVLYSVLFKNHERLVVPFNRIELENFISTRESLRSFFLKNLKTNPKPDIRSIKPVSIIIGHKESEISKKFFIAVKSLLYIISTYSFKMYLLLKKYKRALFFLFLLIFGYIKRNFLINTFQKIISYFLRRRLNIARQEKTVTLLPETVFNEPDVSFDDTKKETNNLVVEDFFRLFLDNLHVSSELNSNPADLLTDCVETLDKPFTNRELYTCALNMVEALTFKFCSDAAYELCIDSVSMEINPKIITKCSDKAFDFTCQEQLLHEGLYLLYTRCISVLHKTACSQQLKLVLKGLMTKYLEYQKLNK